ncbi:MAG: hypothetical protein Q8N30_03145 [Methylococcales bacterium]|nr:hypothetical protein [Methylococcales bacterium]
MKKILITLTIMFGFNNVQADNKDVCLAVMYSGVRTNLLEIHCGFKGEMSKKLAQTFVDMKCVDIISQEEIKVLGEQVSDSLFSQHEKMGGRAFCQAHKKGYMDLFKN